MARRWLCPEAPNEARSDSADRQREREGCDAQKPLPVQALKDQPELTSTHPPVQGPLCSDLADREVFEGQNANSRLSSGRLRPTVPKHRAHTLGCPRDRDGEQDQQSESGRHRRLTTGALIAVG